MNCAVADRAQLQIRTQICQREGNLGTRSEVERFAAKIAAVFSRVGLSVWQLPVVAGFSLQNSSIGGQEAAVGIIEAGL